MKDEWCVSPTDFYWIARCWMNCYRPPLRRNEGTRPLQMRAAATAGPTLPSPLRHHRPPQPFQEILPRAAVLWSDLLCTAVLKSRVWPCDPVHCSPPGCSVHGDSPGKNTGVGCQALLQAIFPTQGSNPGLPHRRWILYHLSPQGSPGYWGKQTLGPQAWSHFQYHPTGLRPTREMAPWHSLCSLSLVFPPAPCKAHPSSTSHIQIQPQNSFLPIKPPLCKSAGLPRASWEPRELELRKNIEKILKLSGYF